MKYILKFIVLVILFSCKNTTDNNIIANDPIVGHWYLIEDYDAIWGWKKVPNGYQLNLHQDQSFNSNNYDECDNGRYSTTNTTIILDYSCKNFTTGIETPEGVFEYEYKLEEQYLLLIPKYRNCFEGCTLKFQKEIF